MTAQVAPSPVYKAFDNNGNPLAFGLLNTYIAGTSTPQATYVDYTQTTQNTNPVVLNARGEANVWLDPTKSYKFILADSLGNQIYSVDQLNGGSLSPSASIIPIVDNIYNVGSSSNRFATGYFGTNVYVGGAPVTTYPPSAAETTAALALPNEGRQNTPAYDMSRYGIQPNGVDNTAIVQAVFNMLKVTGGTMVFPYGDWAFYLDMSGHSNFEILIEGNGSTFRCFAATPAQSCVVYCNNSGATPAPLTAGSFYGSNVTFRNCNFVARLYTYVIATGDINYAVLFNGTNAVFWNCSFTYGAVAAFYGMYCQYTEFWSCFFDSATAGSSTAGCLLDSHGTASTSNECLFDRCKFFSNAVSLWIKGSFCTRVRNSTFQGNTNSVSGGVIILDQDSTTLGAAGTIIDGCWFEVNATNAIYIVVATGTRIINNFFLTSGGNIITNNCYSISFIGNYTYGGITTTLQHTSADGAQITWHGNNFIPTFNISSAASRDLDLHIVGSYTGTLTGCTTAPTATVYYTIQGNNVFLELPSLTATTTTGNLACALTGAPAAISPQTTHYGSALLTNSSATVSGNVDIQPSGQVDFIIGGTTTGFSGTASTTKGVNSGTFVYRLYNN